MLTLSSYSKLCQSLNFDLKKNFEGYQNSLTDIRKAVAYALKYDSPKALNDDLKNSSISVTPEFCDRFCSIVKSQFNYDYYRTPFNFKWPDCIEFTADEVNKFWLHSLCKRRPKIGDDLFALVSPVMQYKKGGWVVVPESPLTADQINRYIGEGIATCEASHTDIVQKLHESAKNGDVAANYNIAQRHMLDKNYVSARETLEKILGLDTQHSGALNCLAIIYCEGAKGCIPIDLEKSERLFRQASELGCHQATHALALGYDLGGVFKDDYEQAFKLHSLAIRLGNHLSINSLITMIFFNRGVPEDLPVDYLEELFSKGKELRDPYTIQRIAEYYERHELKNDEYIFGLRYFCVASGIVERQFNLDLARHYWTGIGCTKDINLAINHYKFEAEKFRCADAMYALSWIYEGELEDENESHYWLNEAFNAIDNKTMHAFHIVLKLGEYAFHNQSHELAKLIFSKASSIESIIDFDYLKMKSEVDKIIDGIKYYECFINYDKDSPESFNDIYKLALSGCTPAKRLLANILIQEDGDLVNGEIWLRMAKDDGCEVSLREYESLFM